MFLACTVYAEGPSCLPRVFFVRCITKITFMVTGKIAPVYMHHAENKSCQPDITMLFHEP